MEGGGYKGVGKEGGYKGVGKEGGGWVQRVGTRTGVWGMGSYCATNTTTSTACLLWFRLSLSLTVQTTFWTASFLVSRSSHKTYLFITVWLDCLSLLLVQCNLISIKYCYYQYPGLLGSSLYQHAIPLMWFGRLSDPLLSEETVSSPWKMQVSHSGLATVIAGCSGLGCTRLGQGC